MIVLITGAEGFAGGHLAQFLRAQVPELELYGTVRPSQVAPVLPDGLLSHAISVDLRDAAAVRDVIETVRPDYIFHLAAQAFVPRSFEDPWETLENNIRSELNLFLALIALDLRPRVLVVSSAEVYGSVPVEQLPITEEHPFAPVNPYSVSKVAQDMLAFQYFRSHNLPVLRVRPFNHIGPGQSTQFAVSAFAMQIARIEAGLQPPVIQVGDLSPERDFTDVRDVVAAYHAVATRGTPGAVYNVCSGRSYSIASVLDALLGLSTISVEIQVDPARLRPVDNPIVVGSAARLYADTGWRPAIPFEQSLRDVLDASRSYVAQSRQSPQGDLHG